jgi:rubrerythrin
MSLEATLARSFLRSLVSHPAGRAHVLSLMVAAEEGDEAGVFDQLLRRADDAELAKLVRRHKEDEERHAAMYRECLARNGLEMQAVPDELLIIRQVAREAGGAFSAALDASKAVVAREDVMNTYALLLAIEERGVQRFPMIGQEFRRIGDHATADTFDRVTEDERRHTRYCAAIGRRHAPDEATWQRAVAKYREVEQRAFDRVGRATLAYAVESGLVWRGWVGGVARGAMGIVARLRGRGGAIAAAAA